MTPPLRGRCLRGQVTYQVDDAFRDALIGHCSQWRRATGSAKKPFAGIERERLRVTAGETALLLHGTAPDPEVRCRQCGSVPCLVAPGKVCARVTLGSLEDSPTIRLGAHIYVGSKAPWEVIADGLPQHKEL